MYEPTVTGLQQESPQKGRLTTETDHLKSQNGYLNNIYTSMPVDMSMCIWEGPTHTSQGLTHRSYGPTHRAVTLSLLNKSGKKGQRLL